MNVRVSALLVLIAAACGGKAVIDAPIGAGGAGGTGNGTTTGTVFPEGSTGTSAIRSCAEIEAAYAAALEVAKPCQAAVNTPQCTFIVPSDLRECCTPKVAVNVNDPALTELRSAYTDQNCLMPCGADCPPSLPVSGVCEPMTGTCLTVEATSPAPGG